MAQPYQFDAYSMAQQSKDVQVDQRRAGSVKISAIVLFRFLTAFWVSHNTQSRT